MGWVVNATPWTLYPRERLGTHCIGSWVRPGSVWTGAEYLAPIGIRSPDCPARSELLYRLSYPGPLCIYIYIYIYMYPHVYVYMCMYVCVYIFCVYVFYVCVYIYIYIYTVLCVCMYVCMYIHKHTYTHTHTNVNTLMCKQRTEPVLI
jgi:hypothetical protein